MEKNETDSMAAPASSQWLSPEEARDYLRLPSLDSLYRRVNRGQLPVHRLGKTLRFDRAELDQALREGAA